MGAYEYIIENVVNDNCDMSWAGNFLEGCAFTAISQTGNGSVQFQQVLSDPPNIPAGARHIGKYWDIQNVAGDSIKIRLYYSGAARADFTGVPTIYHYDTNDNEWKAVATNAEVAEGGAYYVETTDFHAGFSKVSVSDSDAPLPVELTSFAANVINDRIDLHWQTATEVDNYGFQVQRKKSKVKSENDWEEIGFIEGNGNSNSPKEYSFTDNTAINGKYSYRLKQIDFDGQFEYSDVVEVEINNLPTEFSLSQNYPNPFNPITKISFTLPKESYVKLIIYNSLGEQVAKLIDGFKGVGKYQVNFDASHLSSGLYFYRISAGNFVASKKLILVK